MGYSTDQFNEELMHYGVLGMKWGHRKAQPTSGNGSSRYRKAVNKFTNSKIGSKYKLHDDPNEELREVEGTPKKNKVSKKSGGARAEREAISKKLYEQSKSEYKKSQMGRMESEWRKKNQEADADDFGDYLTTKPKYNESKDSHFQKSQKLAADAYKLSKNYVKEQMAGNAAISAMTLAPIAGIAVKKATKSGKAGALAALGVVGTMTVASLVDATKDQRRTYDNYRDPGETARVEENMRKRGARY